MKAQRQAAIRDIIEKQETHTQEELAEALKAKGFNVTQATVSRDIKEMHLFKIMASSGGYRYAVPEKSPIKRQMTVWFGCLRTQF